MKIFAWVTSAVLINWMGCEAQTTHSTQKALYGSDDFDAVSTIVSQDTLAQLLYADIVNTTHPFSVFSSGLAGEKKADMSEVRELTQQLLQQAFLFRANQDSTHLVEAIAYLEYACGLPDWNPDHFLDLAETTFGVSVALHWLGNAVGENLKSQVERTIETHAFDTYLEYASIPGGRFWTRGENNWTVVCNSGLYVASVLFPNLSKSAEVKQMSYGNLLKGFKLYAPDGLWAEGPMYWSYATNYAGFAIEAERWSHGGDSKLMDEIGLNKTVPTYLSLVGPSGLTFNYGDVNEEAISITPSVLKLGEIYGQSEEVDRYLTLMLEKSSRKKTSIDHRFAVFHLLWYPSARRRTVENINHEKLKLIHGSIDIAILSTAPGSDNNLYLAMKGGDASSPHQHRDAGSFVLDFGDVRFFSDLGKEAYGLKTKNGKGIDKHSVYRVSSAAHNVIRVGRNEQKEFQTKPMVVNTSSESVTLDLSNCYSECTSVKRKVSIDQGTVLIEDLVVSCTDSIHWQGMTKAKITVNGNKAVLTLRKRKMMMEVVEPRNASIRIVDPKPFSPQESSNSRYKQIVISCAASANGIKVRFKPK